MLESAIKVFDITTKTALVSNIVANAFISITLNYLWGAINSLQIIAHFPMLNLLMPANAQILYFAIVQIVTFEIIPVDGVMKKI